LMIKESKSIFSFRKIKNSNGIQLFVASTSSDEAEGKKHFYYIQVTRNPFKSESYRLPSADI